MSADSVLTVRASIAGGRVGRLVTLAKPAIRGSGRARARSRRRRPAALVDRTERNGLVRREPDLRDTRGVRVALTPRGSVVARKFYDETCRRIETLAVGLSDAEREMLASLLGRVVLDNEVPVVFLESD
ncbi:hypothetical protein AB0J80_09330 [Actinoplanes sp. NPDC049548]|uniref:MarR family winged helix-turn-helix transcriptional regulator n=1 Tax=Actinoplanes sp. NPDC049548 TaxID=3155152 RepID=UPI003444D0B8